MNLTYWLFDGVDVIRGALRHPPAENVWIVLNRDNFTCVECGKDSWRIDHKFALSDGGGHEVENLQVLCHECHVIKTRKERKARRVIFYHFIAHIITLENKGVIRGIRI